MKSKILLFSLFVFQIALFNSCRKDGQINGELSNIMFITSLRFETDNSEDLE
ncbi:hypothetical protein [Ichthyobacterium seriolicida]|uniref:Uncharacterized protein n=1 Tax=Ichthyobacterium seriolicida TaxID=242600 RepID=A0A1J1EAV5_9FLAO|nr:hypothetical protein [Ichthyobacterium seriolicida]BAV94648.1 hypothetical protein JBKA6_0635 [Ichthyobacterium seriolicida]